MISNPLPSTAPSPAHEPGSLRRGFSIGLWAAQVLTTIAAPIAAAIEIESIIVTGPLLGVVGLMLAVVSRLLRSWTVLLFAISAPLASALCALLIAAFHWGPSEAHVPIATILIIYALGALPVAVISLLRIWRWSVDIAVHRPFAWRFSLKSLLIFTTILCVIFAAGRFIAPLLGVDFPIAFGSFASVMIALSGATLWRFVAKCRLDTAPLTTDPPTAPQPPSVAMPPDRHSVEPHSV